MPLSKNASFRQLATFHAVARLGSVSQAAEEMHLTQPAVSIQIGLLEESAGTPLLARVGRGIRLTEAGDLLAVMRAASWICGARRATRWRRTAACFLAPCAWAR